MLKEEYALKDGEVVNIIPVGDLHIGSCQFNEEFFEFWLETISEIKHNRRIYIMGDMLESASKKVGNSAFSTNMSLEDQKAYLMDVLVPLKDDIVGYCTGNHEARLIKDYNFDIVRDICRELDIPSYNQRIDSFKVNDFTFDVFTRHGKGASGKRHLAMGKLERDTTEIVADLYLQGHNHRCMNWNNLFRDKDGLKRRHYGYTGAFLNYNGYPDSMYLPVEPPAFMTITLDSNRKVVFNDYFCDEVCPDISFMG